MAKRPPYKIEYSPEALEHLLSMDARDYATVVNKVERKLQHEPTLATRNKKLLRANDLAPWEPRVGEWRCSYDVQETPERIVTVRGVGAKKRNRVLIAGVEYEL